MPHDQFLLHAPLLLRPRYHHEPQRNEPICGTIFRFQKKKEAERQTAQCPRIVVTDDCSIQ